MVQIASAGLCILLITYIAHIHIRKYKQYFSGKSQRGITPRGINRRCDNIKMELNIFLVCVDIFHLTPRMNECLAVANKLKKCRVSIKTGNSVTEYVTASF